MPGMAATASFGGGAARARADFSVCTPVLRGTRIVIGPGRSRARTVAFVASTGDSGDAPRAPAARSAPRLQRINHESDHENAGFLSALAGFVPRVAPLTCFIPGQFCAWDRLAAELPELHRTLELRRRVEQLPVLDASARTLADTEVLRACSLLAVVAHAYWYIAPHPPPALPRAVSEPWSQLRARLGRSQEVLSYIDLIVYNWRLRDPARADPMVVENLDLLFPTIGNDEERVFYLTQLEILSRAGPVVRLVAAAQDAVLRDDAGVVEGALIGMTSFLGSIVRRSLPKIDPNACGRSHVNPVVWAKTVAPLAVPFRAGLQGPSGTSSPLFNTLDLFFGRKDYASFLGREIEQLRATYPRAWQSFLGAMAQVSVSDYVQRTGNRRLKEAWHEALDLYAGENGFLGRHRMKVYGFLELAFKVGRSVTIGGFSGVFRDRTWDLVDNELLAAQSERCHRIPKALHPAAERPLEQTPQRYDYSEVAQHNSEEHGYWVVIDGVVYDLSEFMHLHPGGRRIVQAYAGMDATHGFVRAHAGRANVDTLRERYRIGVLRSPSFDNFAAVVKGPAGAVTVDCSSAYRAFVRAVQLLVEMQNALAADQSLQTERLARQDDPEERTPYKLLRAFETHQRFAASYLNVLASETLPGLWHISRGLLFPEASPGWMKAELERTLGSQEAHRCTALIDDVLRDFEAWKGNPRARDITHAIERLDRELLSRIKAELILALREFERHGVHVRQLGGTQVRAGCEQAAALVRRYQRELSQEVARLVG